MAADPWRWALVGLLAGFAADAADVYFEVPPLNPDPGTSFDVGITAAVGGDALGSVFVEIGFDPTVIELLDVTGGASPGFDVAPAADPAAFVTGLVTIAQAQPQVAAPTGNVSLATLRFRAAGPPGAVAGLSLTVLELNDGSAAPLPAQAFPGSIQLGFAAATDTDGDGLSDLEEANAGTDINSPDTDGDLLLDGFEVDGGLDALDDGSGNVDNGAAGDPDGDGLTNLEEQALGTDPRATDSDGDGLDDGVEVSLGTDPADADSDGDGLDDGFEVAGGLDPNDDGGTDPMFGADGDPDGDGLSNLAEQAAGTDPTSADTDGDGLPDDYELANGLDPLDDGMIDSNQGAAGDPDDDGHDNLGEFTVGSDPMDRYSQPVDTVLELSPGLQLLHYPLEPSPGFSAFDLLAELNAGAERVASIRAVTGGETLSLATWSAGAPGGTDFILAPGQGVVAEVVASASLPFTGAVSCPTIGLSAGVNVVGLRCTRPGEDAFGLSARLGPGVATAVQRFDVASARFVTSILTPTAPALENFPIRPGEAYIVNVRFAVPGFDPLQ